MEGKTEVPSTIWWALNSRESCGTKGWDNSFTMLETQDCMSSEKAVRSVVVGEGMDTRGTVNCAVSSNGRTKCSSAVISITNEIAATITKQSSRHLERILI